MVTINVNEYVWFKITELGKEHWEADFNKYPVKDYSFEQHFKKYTKRGWTKMQIWCFMELFGGDNVGMGFPAMFESNIRFEESQFKKQKAMNQEPIIKEEETDFIECTEQGIGVSGI